MLMPSLEGRANCPPGQYLTASLAARGIPAEGHRHVDRGEEHPIPKTTKFLPSQADGTRGGSEVHLLPRGAGEVLILVRSGGWVNGWCVTILALTRGCACSARLHAHTPTHTHTHTHICIHTQVCGHKHTQHYLQFLSGPQGGPSLLLAQMSKGQQGWPWTDRVPLAGVMAQTPICASEFQCNPHVSNSGNHCSNLNNALCI